MLDVTRGHACARIVTTHSVQTTAGGSRVLYSARPESGAAAVLYAVPVDGRAGPVAISHPVAPGELGVRNFSVHASDRVAYISSTNVVSSVAVDGSGYLLLDDSISQAGGNFLFQVTPTETTIYSLLRSTAVCHRCT